MSCPSIRLTVQFTSSPTRSAYSRVDRLALRLTHLLQDDLLGGLRRDAAERFRALWNADLLAHLGARIMVIACAERQFIQRVLNFIHDAFHDEDVNLVGLRINFRREILIGTKLFAGGDQHGIFHRVDDDLRVDAFLFAQNLNGLKYRCQSGCLFLSAKLSRVTTRTSGLLF